MRRLVRFRSLAALLIPGCAALALCAGVGRAVAAPGATDPDWLVVPAPPRPGALDRARSLHSPFVRPGRAALLEPRSAVAGLDGDWIEVPPPARAEHIAIYDAPRNRMVVVGGHIDDPRGGVWVLALAGPAQWTRVPVAGTPPPEIYGGAGAYDSARDRVLLWDSYESPPSSEKVYALSLSTMTWSELATAGTPPPFRTAETMVYDPVRDRMIVYAGWNYSQAYGDLWTLDLGGTPTWTPLAASGGPPPARFEHVAIYDPVRDRMIAFGGYGAPDSSGAVLSIADTWELALAGAPAWNPLAPAGTPPSAPSATAAVYDPLRDRMLVYGGELFNGAVFGISRALTALSFSPAPAWQPVATTAPAGRPPYTSANSAIYDPGGDRVVTFGGSDQTDYYAGPIPDAWAVTVGSSPTWSRITPSTASAAGRVDRTAIVDASRQRMILFAGGESGGDYCCDPADIPTWAYDLQLGTWQALDTKATRPTARMDHTAIYDPVRDRMVIYGGWGYGLPDARTDLEGLSFSGAGGWSALAPTGTPPPGRSGHSAIYDPVRDRMVVFGGVGLTPGARNDVWSLYLSDLRWEQMLPTGPLPSTRRGHIAVYDPVGDRMIVFGGASFGTPDYRDAWALNLGGSPVWTDLGPPTPSPVYFSQRLTGIYDPMRQRMIVVEGLLDGSFHEETWALDLIGPPSWVRLDVGPSPYPNLPDLTAIYDPVHDRALVPDSRSSQLYALEMPPGGPTPTLVSLVSAQASYDQARVIWQLGAGAGASAVIFRRTLETAWRELAQVVADASGRVVFVDAQVTPGARYGYRIGLGAGGPAEAMGEAWLDVPAAPRFALRGAVPNPAASGLRVEFGLDSDARASLDVIDITGRRVLSREVGSLGPGSHALRLDEAGTLRPGVYLIRLSQAGRSLHSRALLVP